MIMETQAYRRLLNIMQTDTQFRLIYIYIYIQTLLISILFVPLNMVLYAVKIL